MRDCMPSSRRSFFPLPVDETVNARAGGKADDYGRMLVEELKPFIDATYPTLPGAPSTGLAGSSLGGLVTMHLGLRYPSAFGRLAVLSPSVWLGDRAIVREVEALDAIARMRLAVVPALDVDRACTEELQLAVREFVGERRHHPHVFVLMERAHRRGKDDVGRAAVAENQQLHVAAEAMREPAVIFSIH